jgi:C4-dicarboxylate-specific signal transduction histidine kinase
MDKDKKIEKLKKKIAILEHMIEKNSLVIYENEEQLAEKNVQIMLNTKLASIGEMVSSITHEINNPIGIIEGQLRQLEYFIEKNDVNKQNELISKMKRNTTRVIKIIKGLTLLSSVSEKEDITNINFSIFLNDFRAFNYVKRVDFDVSIVYPLLTEDVFVHAKETALAQILTNLINNSIDALENEKDIWIKLLLEPIDGKIKLRVLDSGKGIEDKYIGRLFDPFFTTKSFGKGSGIGLSICQKLCKEIEGELTYELYEGHTSFVLELKTS